MRSKFDEQLDKLNKEMIIMGSLCERAIAKSAQALIACDSTLAEAVPAMIKEVNQKEQEIEAFCMRLLLHQQPVARDLRTISAALKMVTDIERIGDQSADIAEIITMGYIKRVDDALPMRELAAAVTKMVTDSMDAFVNKDMKIARSVIEYDDVADGHFNDIKRLIIEQLKHPDTDSEAAVDLLMISKYFERIGDHAVNIAKWVIFSITGKLEDGIGI